MPMRSLDITIATLKMKLESSTYQIDIEAGGILEPDMFSDRRSEINRVMTPHLKNKNLKTSMKTDFQPLPISSNRVGSSERFSPPIKKS